MTAPLLLLVVVLGLAIGSFLNVVIWRVPRGESVVRPPSACPHCGQAISARDNVPVLGWLLLRGKCRACHAPISVRYPLVEISNAVLFAAVALRFGFSAVLPAYCYLAAVGVALALIDIDVKRLPDALTLPSYPVLGVLLAVAAIASGDADALIRAGVGGAGLFAAYFALCFAFPAGMGFGDVKLSGLLGMALGYVAYGALAVGAFAAFLLGGLFSIGLVLFAGAGRRTKVPFGPFMLVGALLGVLWGQELFNGYVSLTVG